MTDSAVHHMSVPIPLAARRETLQLRIQRAREQTGDIVQRLAADVRATEKTRRSIQTGWKVFKAATVAGGVLWSFSATSRLGRGRRFFTLAVSILSTMRAMRRVSALLLPLKQLSKGKPS